MNTLEHTPAGGRHPANISHLVMGIAFLGIVAVWALVQADVVAGDDIRWLLPLPWVVAGAAGLGAWALSLRRQPTEANDHPNDHTSTNHPEEHR
jgi:hypothetical protein